VDRRWGHRWGDHLPVWKDQWVGLRWGHLQAEVQWEAHHLAWDQWEDHLQADHRWVGLHLQVWVALWADLPQAWVGPRWDHRLAWVGLRWVARLPEWEALRWDHLQAWGQWAVLPEWEAPWVGLHLPELGDLWADRLWVDRLQVWDLWADRLREWVGRR
jgi:hypothetical protein